MRDAAEWNDFRDHVVKRMRRHGGSAEHRPIAEAARIEHGAEPTHKPFRATSTDKGKKVGLRAVQLARKRLKRAGTERDAALQFGEPTPFRGIHRHFFSGFSVPS